tara:strand:- start:374 stop:496 length:123 start_codon:yes stop_codon:yes gene_type:complete
MATILTDKNRSRFSHIAGKFLVDLMDAQTWEIKFYNKKYG